jgi:hypothetical protein
MRTTCFQPRKNTKQLRIEQFKKRNDNKVGPIIWELTPLPALQKLEFKGARRGYYNPHTNPSTSFLFHCKTAMQTYTLPAESGVDEHGFALFVRIGCDKLKLNFRVPHLQ